MKTVFNGQIVGLRKLNNSVNGNPKFKVRIYKFDETIDVNTATDAGFAYAIYGGYIGKYGTFVVNGRNQLVDIKVEA